MSKNWPGRPGDYGVAYKEPYPAAPFALFYSLTDANLFLNAVSGREDGEFVVVHITEDGYEVLV